MNKLVIKIVKDTLTNDPKLQQEIINKVSSRVAERLENGELKLDEARKTALNNDYIYSLFVTEALMSSPGCRLAARELHRAFHLWHKGHISRTGCKDILSYRSDGGRTLIGRNLGKILYKKKIGGLYYYLDIGIKNATPSDNSGQPGRPELSRGPLGAQRHPPN
jgi:hypothetical protein